MANYTKEKSKFGGMTGSIQIFTSFLSLSNDPLDETFKSKIPAGYLRCDGSIKTATDYPELARILGTGSNCRFKKDATTLTDNQFQLPDLGSKYLSPGLATGTYSDLTLIQSPTTKRVGVEVEVSSNVGNSVTIDYSGNFTVQGSAAPIPLLGNAKLNPPNPDRKTASTILDGNNFQAHGHGSNAYVLNYIGNFKLSGEGKSGLNCNPLAGNSLQSTGSTANTTSQAHTHNITWPTTYSSNFVYNYPTFNVPADNVQTTVNLSTKSVKVLNDSVTPFILVEYIIKF